MLTGVVDSAAVTPAPGPRFCTTQLIFLLFLLSLFLLCLPLPLSLNSPEYLLFTRHSARFYGELALDSCDPLSVGPGPCFEISKAHLLSFPDVLFPRPPVTQFPSLPPGCPKSLIITPHPGLSLQEVPLVSDLPLARVCGLPCPNYFYRISQMDA